MGNCKEHGQQTVSRTNSLVQYTAARGKETDWPISPSSGVSFSFAGSPQLLLQRKKVRKESLGQGEAQPHQEQRRDSHGDTATNQLGTQLTTCSFLHSHGFSSQFLCPITGWRPTPPYFYQGWHKMPATEARKDQLSPQALRAGAKEWRERIGEALIL